MLKKIDKIFGKLSRSKMIQSVGIIGILANAVFAAIKLIIGIMSNSISIISDAVNNLSDALSSVITLVGLKLSQKPPDHKHPLGYGRIEYISSLVISMIILFAGVEFLQTSLGRIRHPQAVEFTLFQFIILGITLIGKFLLSRLNISVGKLANSLALQGSGAEAMTDVAASAATIVTAMIAKFTGMNIDGYVGLMLSLFIIYTGIVQLRDTISNIIGERADKELVDALREDLAKYPQILGAYDFIVHSYGPTTKIGTANIEFTDILSVKDAYDVMYQAQREIMQKHQTYFTFGLYSVNTYDAEVSKMYGNLRELLANIPYIMGLHAFHVDKDSRVIRFDVVVDFTISDFEQAKKVIERAVRDTYPDYSLELNVDLDYA